MPDGATTVDNIDTLRVRLRFIRMDDDLRAALRAAKPLIASALPQILDQFYTHIRQFPEVARLFTNPALMNHAKAMQIKHWEKISDARFDEDYVASVMRIGETHHRLGLEPQWYIGGYSFLITGLARAIVTNAERSRFNRTAARETTAKMLTAIVTAALLDMDFAIAVYLDSGLRAKQETLDRLGASFRNVIATVSSASVELEATVGTLDQTSESTRRSATAVTTASEQASASVQVVASATEQLMGSLNEITRQVQKSNGIAADAVGQAKKIDARIAELSQAAGEIDKVVMLITAIAKQTNLLALNATIEAARAGKSGQGFSVVAQEVKTLAAQTAEATDEISDHIAGIQAATSDSIATIKEIGSTIGRIAEIASAIARAVEEQNAATQEIASNAEQAAESTQHVTQNISEVNKATGETSSASKQVLASAKSLATQSVRLTGEVDEFLNSIRVA